MMSAKILCLLILVTTGLPTLVSAQANDVVPLSILVKFRQDAAYHHLINSHRRQYQNRSDIRMVSPRKSIYKFSFETVADVLAAKTRFEQDPAVETVVFNHKLTRRGGTVTPNDPLFSQQWNLDKIGLPALWEKTTGGLTPCGDTIVIAVFDFGFDQQHEDMQDLIWYNRDEIPNNGFDDDQNGYKDDYAGLNLDTGDDKHGIAPDYHGTSVSSVIAANSNNGLGLAGVNWQVKLLIVSSEEKDQALAVEAYEYILALRKKYNDTNGAEGAYIVAVNNSWGQEGLFEEDFQLMCDMYNDLGESGILSVGSTENDQVNTDVFGDIPSDCSSDYLIIVTNTDQKDELAVGGFGKMNVDLGAPGEQIRVVAASNSYGYDSGTSFSAPHVTGAIGLIYSLEEAPFCDHARLSPTEAILDLKRYILDGVTLNETLEGRTVSGGRLNLGRTVDMVTASRQPRAEAVHAYPNPVNANLYIDRGDFGDHLQLVVRDITGRIVYEQSTLTGPDILVIQTGHWPSGTYVVQLRSQARTGFQKVVKL